MKETNTYVLNICIIILIIIIITLIYKDLKNRKNFSLNYLVFLQRVKVF